MKAAANRSLHLWLGCYDSIQFSFINTMSHSVYQSHTPETPNICCN